MKSVKEPNENNSFLIKDFNNSKNGFLKSTLLLTSFSKGMNLGDSIKIPKKVLLIDSYKKLEKVTFFV